MLLNNIIPCLIVLIFVVWTMVNFYTVSQNPFKNYATPDDANSYKRILYWFYRAAQAALIKTAKITIVHTEESGTDTYTRNGLTISTAQATEYVQKAVYTRYLYCMICLVVLWCLFLI